MSNAGWPESYGFSIGGGRPALITAVQKSSVAQSAGLLVGDMISQLDEHNVQACTCQELVEIARQSQRAPPSLNVISRIITIEIPRRRNTPLGFTLRGDGPLYVRSVEVNGLARKAGMRSGDMLLQVDGRNVQHQPRAKVQELIEQGTEAFLRLVLISSGLEPLPKLLDRSRPTDRYAKARIFYEQMDFYLMGEDSLKDELRRLLKNFANDKSVDKLGHHLHRLLQSPIQRRLLKYVREFVPDRSQPQFDVLVGMDSDIILGDRHRRTGSFSLASSSSTLDRSTSSSTASLNSRGRSNSDAAQSASHLPARPRRVQVHRGEHGFGFNLRGKTGEAVLVVAVAPGGPAQKAGILPGDKLLEVNGLDVRRLAYKQVLELLDGSGTKPFLLVESPPRRTQQGMGRSLRQTQSVVAGSNAQAVPAQIRPQSSLPTAHLRKQSSEFKMKMEQMLTKADRTRLMEFLAQYHKDKKLEDLVHKLIALLKKQPQLQLLHSVCQLLPESVQEKFDRTAAASLARLARAVQGARGSESGENMQDILYRVQGQSQSPGDTKQRYLPGGGGGRGGGGHSGESVPGGDGELRRVPAGMKLVPEHAVMLKDGQRVVQVRQQGAGGQGSRSQGKTLEESFAEFDEDGSVLSEHLGEPTPMDSPITRRVRAGTGTDYDAKIAEAKAVGEQTAKVQLRERSKKLNEDQKAKMAVKRTSLLGTNLESLVGGKVSPSPSPLTTSPPPAPPSSAMGGAISPPPAFGPGMVPPPPPLPGGIPPPPPLGPGGIPIPPPLGPDGIPLPPPMGMVPLANQKKLKHLNWDKLTPTNLQGTIWAEEEMYTDADLGAGLESTEVEESFAAQDSSAAAKGKKKKERNLIDSRKALNISILLGHLKMSHAEIKRAVLRLDTETLSEQHLRVMKDFAPDEKEHATLQAYSGKLDKFSKADQFAYELTTIPKYSERLNALLFKMHFNSKVQEIKPDLEAIISASRQLRGSASLRGVLKIILKIGNTLNQGNARIGHATGFKIAFLNKLEATRTTDNKSNLLQFVVRKANENFGGDRFVHELSGLQAAARVSSQTLRDEVQEIRTQLDKIKADVLDASMMQEQMEGDRFQEVMDEFLITGTVQMDELNRLYLTMEQEFKEVVTYFGEEPATTRSDEFFVVFSEFIQSFRRASLELDKAKEAEVERKKREEAREERKRMLAKRGKSSLASEQSAEVKDIADFRKLLKPSRDSPLAVRRDMYGEDTVMSSDPEGRESDGDPLDGRRRPKLAHHRPDAIRRQRLDSDDSDNDSVRLRQQAPRRSAAAAAASASFKLADHDKRTETTEFTDTFRHRMAAQDFIDDEDGTGSHGDKFQYGRGFDFLDAGGDSDDAILENGLPDFRSLGQQSFF